MGFKEKRVYFKDKILSILSKVKEAKAEGKLEDNRNAVTRGQHNGAGEEIYRRCLIFGGGHGVPV